MFEKPIIIPLDIFKNALKAVLFFKSLRLEDHLIVMNRLLNDISVTLYPQFAIPLLVPQKKQLMIAKTGRMVKLKIQYPQLTTIETH